MPILTLAMPTPLRRSFDYLPPEAMDDETVAALPAGVRIEAPFGNRKLIGILLATKASTDIDPSKIKRVTKVLDQHPILTDKLLSLSQWAASYYQHPLGDAFANAIPNLLRKGEALIPQTQSHWQLTTEGKGLPEGALKRAAKQAQLLGLLQQQGRLNRVQLDNAAISQATCKALIEKGLIERVEVLAEPYDHQQDCLKSPHLKLNHEQKRAVDTIHANTGFQCYLLEGVTGSGKTEVYLQLIEQCLKRQQQALVLIPEIGLTPQTLSRFNNRFNCPIVTLHSGLTDRERLLAWQHAQSGEAGIILGTRSAVFTATANLGLVIIDEEHDSSFKQQDGFRYSARDIAIKRAADEQCPIVLGSATPSLETLNNALQGRYHHLPLKSRATGASAPAFELLDIRHAPMEDGFSPALISAIGNEIKRGNQVLVFINRRGFSPMLMCHDCGYVAQCQLCDARMTVHFQQRLLRCHHCESQAALPHQCPECNGTQLDFRGSGTERSEQALKRLFPSTDIKRIDRDTTSRKQAMQQLVAEVHKGEPCILVGTQMLAKGHHFPDVTLVAVLDADGGLFSADFRGPEKMGQLLVQVAGRAGREAKAGKVIIQTHQPEHPLITSLVNDSYHHYARAILSERQASGLPPFAHLALLRAEANNLEQAEALLQDLRGWVDHSGCQVFGPLPAPMTRKAGRFRAQLLIRADQRKPLHRTLQQLCSLAEQHPLANKVRWSIDVDPSDMF
ncbi:primosomal protein N' [Oceanicoccus sagamiensis]|uniref:Replication restart protein PriA n=1 Tax=Oceanicoccus sagamiensis TaxID=716816 RepID=A0A1X9N8K1_9GAMM|nr:primosomal protein N' [Oceanicoccus sagamiensis]ARN74398.1 primosomal protein N' [Oceanicoccus sagamiensis]